MALNNFKCNHLMPLHLGEIPLLVFEIWRSRFSRRTNSHSLTKGTTRKQNASGTEGFRCWRHKNRTSGKETDRVYASAPRPGTGQKV